jgi:hypothetical protein
LASDFHRTRLAALKAESDLKLNLVVDAKEARDARLRKTKGRKSEGCSGAPGDRTVAPKSGDAVPGNFAGGSVDGQVAGELEPGLPGGGQRRSQTRYALGNEFCGGKFIGLERALRDIGVAQILIALERT